MTQIVEACTWFVMWLLLSLLFGAYFGGHGWILIPTIGALYGAIAGMMYALGSLVFRNWCGPLNIVPALLIGLGASICTTPLAGLVGVEPLDALLFAIVAGPLSGIFVRKFVKHNYED